MDKRRFIRLVASIFGAALLFATIAVVPGVAQQIALDPSANSAQDEDNDNDHGVVCSGTLSDNDNTCTIIQGSPTQPTDNRAECRLFSNKPDVTQRCIITQTSGAGNNQVRVRMRIAQEKTATPFTGVCAPYPTRSLALSNQNACQILAVKQTSVSGSNSLEGKLKIAQELEGQQEDDQGQPGGQRLHQFQNAGQNHKVNQDSQTGVQRVKLDLSQSQREESEVTADQFERSTGGISTAQSTITQTSNGVSDAERKFSVRQTQNAPAGTQGTQRQDPDDWCCSPQGTNPNDRFKIDLVVRQAANLRFASQADNIVGNFVTTGNGTVRQSVTTNGGTTTNSCSGKTCFIVITCGVEGGCFASKPPAPTPTPIPIG